MHVKMHSIHHCQNPRQIPSIRFTFWDGVPHLMSLAHCQRAPCLLKASLHRRYSHPNQRQVKKTKQISHCKKNMTTYKGQTISNLRKLNFPETHQLHPWKLVRNLKMYLRKGVLLWNIIVLGFQVPRFHINLRGCILSVSKFLKMVPARNLSTHPLIHWSAFSFAAPFRWSRGSCSPVQRKRVILQINPDMWWYRDTSIPGIPGSTRWSTWLNSS